MPRETTEEEKEEDDPLPNQYRRILQWAWALTLKLPTKALPREFAFNRYWKIADEMLDNPEKTTTPGCQQYTSEKTIDSQAKKTFQEVK
jgi:hypothetical protein